LSELVGLFIDNLLPIFLIAGAGFLLGKKLEINPRSVSRVTYYIFSPCFIFTLITSNHLNNNDILRMAGFACAMALIVGVITWGAALALKLQRQLLVAVLLTTLFMNAGNYGLPLNLFAFGEEAMAHASIYFITMFVLTNSVGIVIASMGSSGFLTALTNLLKIPMVYALILAFLYNRLNWELPLPIARTVDLLARATIPCMLVLLGLQLQGANWKAYRAALALSCAIRLVVAPLIAIGVSTAFGLQGAARQAGIVETAMPSAVLATILATEYDAQPNFVTAAVFTSTLLSPLTLTPLLAYLS